MKAQPRETHVPKGGGILAACLVSLAMAFFTGLGGALISIVVGVVTCVIVSSILSNGLSYEREDMLGSAQLDGVLDSSQLDGPSQYDDAQLPTRLQQCGRIVVAASVIAALASSGLVLVATGGNGFRVWLGGFSLFPTTTQREQKKPTNTDNAKDSTSTTRQYTDESEDVYYEEWTHYPEDGYEEDYTDYEEPQQNNPESSPTENTPAPAPSAESGTGTDTGAGATTDTSATTQTNTQGNAPAGGQPS